MDVVSAHAPMSAVYLGAWCLAGVALLALVKRASVWIVDRKLASERAYNARMATKVAAFVEENGREPEEREGAGCGTWLAAARKRAKEGTLDARAVETARAMGIELLQE